MTESRICELLDMSKFEEEDWNELLDLIAEEGLIGEFYECLAQIDAELETVH
jgi:hypothetical protein